MKRVLRSCINPLPRFLSTRGLALLVFVLVAGTAVSVHEYLQTTRLPRGSQVRTPSVRTPARPGEVRAAERTRITRSAPTCTLDLAPTAERVPSAASGAGETGARPAALFGPDSTSPGT